jgi:hypothetical protein
MKNSKKNIFWIYWMFYMPLAVVYITAIASLYVGYRQLRHGISSTVIHRMKALVTNALNVIIYLLYWTVLGFCLLLSFVLIEGPTADFFFSLTLFVIAAKGVSALIVRILTVGISFVDDTQQKNKLSSSSEANIGSDADVEEFDLNRALRQELLYFATTGIRNCTDKGAELTRNQAKLVLRLQRAPELVASTDDLSPLFFLYLILGRTREKNIVVKLANTVRKKRVSAAMTALELAVLDENEYHAYRVKEASTIGGNNPEDSQGTAHERADSPDLAISGTDLEEGRLSQRCRKQLRAYFSEA